jgi:hypothetical protein
VGVAGCPAPTSLLLIEDNHPEERVPEYSGRIGPSDDGKTTASQHSLIRGLALRVYCVQKMSRVGLAIKQKLS